MATKPVKLEKFEIKSRWSDEICFSCEVDASFPFGWKLGAAIKLAIKADANLTGANLTGAYLTEAYLARANLARANLTGAYLTEAYLARANLAGANLTGANLTDANLTGANLTGANLTGANLADANLTGANLADANLTGAKIDPLTAARASIVPEEGDYIGWKKCQNDALVKLLIPADAKRSNATGRKCRASHAKVLEVIGAEFGISQHDRKTRYVVGEVVHCHKWDENRWNECSGGIHHYLTRIEAANH